MEKTIRYSKIESITYCFSEEDMRRALMSHFGINHPGEGKLELNLYEGEYDERGDLCGPAWAEMIVNYQTSIAEDA